MISKLTKHGSEYAISYEQWELTIGTAGAETVGDAERYEREGWPMPIGADEAKHKRGWSRAR